MVLVSALAGVPFVMADSWPSATTTAVASENGQIVVRVTPGDSIGDTYGFSGAPKGKFASAQWFRFRDNRYDLYQTVQLVNPVAPTKIVVADDGTLLTLDNWHNLGFGYVVVIYAPDGKLRRHYRLEDLYSADDIAKIERSVSSRWWRCMTIDPSVQHDGTVQVDDSLGGRFSFHLEDGTRIYNRSAGECKP